MRNTDKCTNYGEDDLSHLTALTNALMTLTGKSWTYVASPRSVGTGGYKEYYAFVFQTDRVKCTTGGALYPDADDDFVREPFYASFRSGDFDFTAAIVHIYWGDGTDDPEDEVEALDDVWDYLQDLDEHENDILLLGDFNVHKPTASPFGDLLAAGVDPLVRGTDFLTTYSTGTSSIGASWYDNIWADHTYSAHEFTWLSGVDYLHRRFFLDTSWPHLEVREHISDHCPVWAQFFITKGDDD